MKILIFLEKNFCLVLALSLTLGLFFPLFGKGFNNVAVPFFMIILFLTCLKIDYRDIFKHLKQPVFLIYILCVYLLIIPAITYVIFQYVKPELAIGFLLLASLPPATTATLLTDLVKGNTSLSLTISLCTYLLAPFTVSLIFFLFTKQEVSLDIWSLMKTLILINIIPLVSAQIVRKVVRPVIIKTQKHYSRINLILLFLIVYIVVANQAQEILSQPFYHLVDDMFWLYAFFIVLHIIGYFVAFWRKKEDKVALSITKTYINVVLAMGLANTFFDPKIAFLMVLSEVPWNTTIGVFTYSFKKMR